MQRPCWLRLCSRSRWGGAAASGVSGDLLAGSLMHSEPLRDAWRSRGGRRRNGGGVQWLTTNSWPGIRARAVEIHLWRIFAQLYVLSGPAPAVHRAGED
jgi:hypothetical protein